jgi:hypothetical protein
MKGGHAIRGIVGPRWATWGRIAMRGLGYPNWGNLRRVTPFSATFGFDRGTPIDRYYVDAFMSGQRPAITGRVLEIQTNGYTTRFGVDVIASHTLDIRAEFSPTYLCDLALAGGVVPTASYDCFLLPNTLPFIRDLEPALHQARRIVRPGGTILATVPCLVPLTGDVADYWRLSADGWRVLAARVWPGCHIEVTAYGNVLTAAAAMYGITVEELTPAELDADDPRYPVLVTIACRTVVD